MPAEEVVTCRFLTGIDWEEDVMNYEPYLHKIREKRPLVHCLTNIVTVQDVANIILACGASPVMATDIREMDDFVGLAQSVVINIGTMSPQLEESFEAALSSASRLGKPVVLDPVGVGAAKYRTSMILRFLERYPVAVIRGNASEIRCLAGEAGTTVGVDAAAGDAVTAETLAARSAMAAGVAQKYRCVVAMSGAWDVITDGKRHLVCKGGVPQMSQVTGTGCMLTGLTASFLGGNPDAILEATYAATELMCACGESAWRKTSEAHAGLSTFRTFLIDAISLA